MSGEVVGRRLILLICERRAKVSTSWGSTIAERSRFRRRDAISAPDGRATGRSTPPRHGFGHRPNAGLCSGRLARSLQTSTSSSLGGGTISAGGTQPRCSMTSICSRRSGRPASSPRSMAARVEATGSMSSNETATSDCNIWWEASGEALCMPSGEAMWLSRVRQNLTHGSLRGRRKRADATNSGIEPVYRRRWRASAPLDHRNEVWRAISALE
jgi:hypothetical protein